MRILAVVALVILGATAAAATPPRVDEAGLAKGHYETAEELYRQGDYEQAIAEYRHAYELKPHANTVYNIAQAYERLLDYAQSVIWFERYLREAPADAAERRLVENRLRVLRHLPARVSVTTSPEHAEAEVRDEQGKVVAEETPTTFKLPAGRYTLRVEAPGWEAEAQPLTLAIGQPYFYQFHLKRRTEPVTIVSRPEGARVFIDERLVGETPFSAPLDVGSHQLLLEHRDYPWHRELFEVRPGGSVVREIRLTRPLHSGRTELVIGAMALGGAAGPLLMSSILGDSKFGGSSYGLSLYLLSAVAGVGGGFLASFLPTRDGAIEVGKSSLMIGGALMGSALFTGTGLGLKMPSRYIAALALAGSGVGMATGYLVARRLGLHAGDAALVNSGALWGGGGGALLAQSIFRTPSERQLGWFLVGGTALGIATGGLLAWKLELGRGHVGYIDVGGLVGTGLGFALGYVIGVNSGGEDNIQVGARYALGGMALGLLAGAVLTRHFKDAPRVEALVRYDAAGKTGHLKLGLPAFTLVPPAQHDPLPLQAVLTLARGSW